MSGPNGGISGTTRIYAILGDPIASVRSPALLNRLFFEQSADAVCIPMHVRAADLPSALRGLSAVGNLDGLLVTMPHKRAIVPLIDALAPSAAPVGAVNVVRRAPGGGWLGDLLTHWTVVPTDPAGWVKPVSYVGLVASILVLTLVRDPIRTVLLVPVLVLASFVWENVMLADPSSTRYVVLGAILVAVMIARPAGLLGERRVEIV